MTYNERKWVFLASQSPMIKVRYAYINMKTIETEFLLCPAGYFLIFQSGHRAAMEEKFISNTRCLCVPLEHQTFQHLESSWSCI